jgi:hypothetical protein
MGVNAVYYSRFQYELKAATITNIELLCQIGNATVPGFECPKPIYYSSYHDAADEMRNAYGVIMPLDITLFFFMLAFVAGFLGYKFVKHGFFQTLFKSRTGYEPVGSIHNFNQGGQDQYHPYSVREYEAV